MPGACPTLSPEWWTLGSQIKKAGLAFFGPTMMQESMTVQEAWDHLEETALRRARLWIQGKGQSLDAQGFVDAHNTVFTCSISRGPDSGPAGLYTHVRDELRATATALAAEFGADENGQGGGAQTASNPGDRFASRLDFLYTSVMRFDAFARSCRDMFMYLDRFYTASSSTVVPIYPLAMQLLDSIIVEPQIITIQRAVHWLGTERGSHESRTRVLRSLRYAVGAAICVASGLEQKSAGSASRAREQALHASMCKLWRETLSREIDEAVPSLCPVAQIICEYVSPIDSDCLNSAAAAAAAARSRRSADLATLFHQVFPPSTSIAPLEADLKKRGANAVLVPFERQIRELWGMGNGDFTRVAWKVHQHCGHLDAILQEWKERKQTQASLQQPVTKKGVMQRRKRV